MSSERFVLDASALLALLNEESGGEIVADALPGAAMSTVNLSEVVAKLSEHGMPIAAVENAVSGLGIELHDFDRESAFATGALRPDTKGLGLSLGDRACIALGTRLGLPVLTADRRWTKLGGHITVHLVR